MCKAGSLGLIEARFLLLTYLCYVAHKWQRSKSKQLHGEGGQTDRARLRLACQSLAAHQKCQPFVLLPASEHHSNIQHIIYPPIIRPLSLAVCSQESTISSGLEKAFVRCAPPASHFGSPTVVTFTRFQRHTSYTGAEIREWGATCSWESHSQTAWCMAWVTEYRLVCVCFSPVAHVFKSVGCCFERLVPISARYNAVMWTESDSRPTCWSCDCPLLHSLIILSGIVHFWMIYSCAVVILECLLLRFTISLIFISHIHQEKSPKEVFVKGRQNTRFLWRFSVIQVMSTT